MSRGKKNGQRRQQTASERQQKSGHAAQRPERTEQLLHMQVRGFAGAGWKAGATDTNNGIRWRWYRDGSYYVIAGRIVIGDKVSDDVGDADITGRFSPADVLRIRATA